MKATGGPKALPCRGRAPMQLDTLDHADPGSAQGLSYPSQRPELETRGGLVTQAAGDPALLGGADDNLSQVERTTLPGVPEGQETRKQSRDVNQLSLFIFWKAHLPVWADTFDPHEAGDLRTETTLDRCPAGGPMSKTATQMRAINSTKSNKTEFTAFSPKL